MIFLLAFTSKATTCLAPIRGKIHFLPFERFLCITLQDDNAWYDILILPQILKFAVTLFFFYKTKYVKVVASISFFNFNNFYVKLLTASSTLTDLFFLFRQDLLLWQDLLLLFAYWSGSQTKTRIADGC